MALVLLFLKIFFVSFFGLYAILIIIRNIEKIVSKILEKVHFHSKILKNIYFFFTNDDWYFYNFALLNKYKKIKFLIPFLFIIDIIILIVCDIFEIISTVILIPLIFEQLSTNKEKLEN